MRRLMWFTIGFALGCGLCVTVCWQMNLLPLLVYAIAAGSVCFALKFRNDLFRYPAVVFFGLTLSFVWFFVFRIGYLRLIEPLDGTVVPLRVTAIEYSEETEYGLSVDGFTVINGKPYRLRVYQSDDWLLSPGDVLESDFLLRLTTPDGEKASSYHQGTGVFLLAAQEGKTEWGVSEQNEIFFLPARAARTAKSRISEFFPSDTAPFAKALFLGDTSELSYRVDTALKVSGIRHVAAVSGLHVSILFGLLYLVLGRRRWLRFFVTVPVLLFFAAVTGFTPSVSRACLMCGLMALGGAVDGEYDGLTSLSFAALCMLAANPFVLLNVSFQLSVASVTGILLFASPIAAWIRNRFGSQRPRGILRVLLTWFSGSISVSLGAMVFSLPLSAYYFGMVSLVGILTNLLTIWLMPVLFCGIAAVCLLAEVLPGACGVLGWLIAWPIRYVLGVAGLLSRIPFAAVYTQSPFITAWLIACYSLLAVFLLRGKRHGKGYFALGTVFLAGAIAASILVPQRDALRLNVLDVGEGQAILLQSGGENYLIDCGGSQERKAADLVAQTLLSQGIFRLDGLVLTHYDRDHDNALDELLTRIEVGRFYFPDIPGKERVSLLIGASAGGMMIDGDTEIPLGTGKITLLKPGNTASDNENCMCVLFESQECVILITGDRSRTGERALLRRYSLPLVDILIAGHHGSGKSTSRELLQAIHPQTVIISVGTNRYGHPSQALLERLAEFNCNVYRTDLHGSVLIRR